MALNPQNFEGKGFTEFPGIPCTEFRIYPRVILEQVLKYLHVIVNLTVHVYENKFEHVQEHVLHVPVYES